MIISINVFVIIASNAYEIILTFLSLAQKSCTGHVYVFVVTVLFAAVIRSDSHNYLLHPL